MTPFDFNGSLVNNFLVIVGCSMNKFNPRVDFHESDVWRLAIWHK